MNNLSFYGDGIPSYPIGAIARRVVEIEERRRVSLEEAVPFEERFVEDMLTLNHTEHLNISWNAYVGTVEFISRRIYIDKQNNRLGIS